MTGKNELLESYPRWFAKLEVTRFVRMPELHNAECLSRNASHSARGRACTQRETPTRSMLFIPLIRLSVRQLKVCQ